MRLKKYKTLDLESFGNDVNKCLSPVIKKTTKEIIDSNIKEIKDIFHSYDITNLNIQKQNNELVESNKVFKNHLNKYYSFKQFLKEKNKHKNKKKEINNIDNLILLYFKKGYKIPNFYHNLFKRSPLNFEGLPIKQYFNELYKKEKKEISFKEKNVDFLIRLQKSIKNIKISKAANKKSQNNSLNRKSIIAMQKLKKFESLNNIEKNMTSKNSISQSKLKSRNSEELIQSENLKSLFNRKSSNITDNNKYSMDNDEEFKELNDYEKKRILKLMEEERNAKSYKKFIHTALSDKNFFKIIDNNDILLNLDDDKKKEEESISFNSNRNNKYKSSISIKNIKIKSKPTSEESSFSSRHQEISSSKSQKKIIPVLSTKRISLNPRNYTIKPKFKKSLTIRNDLNIKISKSPVQYMNHRGSTFNNTNKFFTMTYRNNNIKNKRKPHSIKLNSFLNFLKSINEDEKMNKNDYLLKYKKYSIKDLKLNNIFKYKYLNNNNNNTSMKNAKALTKEENLNYLFKKINSQIILDNKFINELKTYFIKNKDISEDSLNKHINKKYEIKDLLSYCTSIDQKVKEGNIRNKWKKNYLRIGKLDDIKPLLKEEEKQDYYIKHLLQNFMNSVDSKRNFNEFE